MLHILLLIIKIILIIIAVLVGLVLAALLAVLFVPIRYRIEGQYNDMRKYAFASCSWLLHIISIQAGYDKDGGAQFAIRLFGIQLNKAKTKTESDGSSSRTSGSDKKKKDRDKNKVEHKAAKTVFESEPAEDNNVESVGLDKDQKSEPEADGIDKTGNEETGNEEKSSFKDKISSIAKFKDKLKNKFQKVKDKVIHMKDNIKETTEKVSAALHNDDYKQLAKFIKRQVIELFKIIKPRKGRLYVRFGFDDIETTGKAAMYLAVLYGIIGADIEIIPDFNEKIFEGEAYIKGSIRLIGVAVIALRCFFNTEFRRYILKK